MANQNTENMDSDNQIILYRLPDGEVKVEAVLKDETLWLTQKAMAQVFDVNVSGISRHIGNILKSGELDEKSNLQKMQIANSDTGLGV